tara:strand:- start:157 stop:942 length:786 start_codon:yes stop_codon:yes gene_type:complete
MKALDTFRFTSLDKAAIEQIASIYGGVVKTWTPPRSKQEQWEVITTTSEIRVYLPPHSIDVWYEAWSGGGCQRRCDGVTAEVPLQTPDGMDIDTVPCLCETENSMACAPYTRLRVVLPDVRFGGVWRLESKGWNAANEMPGMAGMMEQMQAIGLAECQLVLEKRTKVSGGQTKHFVVPRLTMDASPQEIMAGGGQATALESPSPPIAVPVLAAVSEKQDDYLTMIEDAVIDAEIVEGWDVPPPGIKVVKNPNAPPKFLPAP